MTDHLWLCVWLTAALTLGVVIAPSCMAAVSMDEAAPCASIGADGRKRDFPELRLDFERVARVQLERAVELACLEGRAARSDDDRLLARADLGAALISASRESEALAVLDRAIGDMERVANVDPVVGAALHFNRGNAYRLTRELKRAEADLDIARSAQASAGRQQSLLYAQTLIGLSSLFERQLRIDDADRAIEEADSILARLGMRRTRDAVDVLNERTMIAYARQDLPGTLRQAEAAAALLQSIAGADDVELLEPYATMTAVRSMLGDFVGSEAVAREALRIVDLHPDQGIDARLGIVQNLAVTYLDRAQPREALPLAIEALGLSERHYGVGAPAVLRAHLTLAQTYAALARYADAFREFDQAAAIAARQPETIAIVQRLRLLLGKAALDLKMGDLDRARDDIVRVEDAIHDQPKLVYWRAWQARIACKIDAIAEDWRAADADCARANAYQADVFDAGHSLVADAIAGRCLAQTLGRLPGDACDALRSRLQVGPGLDPRLRVFAYESLATMERAHGQIDEAFGLRVQALAASEEVVAPDPKWAAEHALAQSLAERGQRRLAIFFGKRSIASIETMRSSLGADKDRFERGFLSNKLIVYRHVADWLLDEGRTAEAIETLRLLKVEEMFDFTERAAIDDARPTIVFTPRETALSRAFDRDAAAPLAASPGEVARLVGLRDAKKITAAEQARLTQLFEGAERRQGARAEQIGRIVVEEGTASNADEPASKRSSPPGSGRFDDPRAFEADQADAYLFVTGTRLQLVFVCRSGVTRSAIEIDPALLNRRIADFLVSLSSSRSMKVSDRAGTLYDWLGAPIDRAARAHGIRRIRLWLDGPLRYVPFAALWDGRRYLVERYELSYRLAAPVAARSASLAGRTPLHTVLAFGVTRSLDGLPALPGVKDELCSIVDGPLAGLEGDVNCTVNGRASGMFVGAGFANDYFTEARLRSTIASRTAARNPSTDMIHLGTHLSLRPGNIQRSWLLLGDGGHLPLSALQSIDLAGVDLITLSACQSGMAGGIGDDGREIEGLPTLLHRSGARTVMASLWRVDDRSTARLMRTFYQDLKRPSTTAAAALRNAQIALLRSDGGAYASPYYWAAFVPSSNAD